jgi:predicted ATP-grasp superfamily ATP-dependent carboligase
MRDALAEDFRRVPGCSVTTLDGVLEADEPAAFRAAAAAADWTVVIAPEFDAILETRCQWVLDAGGKLLGPSVEAVRRTADKLAMAEHWAEAGVPSPRTWPLGPSVPDVIQCVVKPQFGAGSTATRRVDDPGRFAEVVGELRVEFAGPMIVQEYVPGEPASVAFLCGPAGDVPLLPGYQALSDDGRFYYRGGTIPVDPEHAARAVSLARRAVGCIRGLGGYVGVDLVLGPNPDGSGDHAIEINPRLTTSYVGLRALADFNLADAMVRVAEGLSAGPLRWKAGAVRFTPDGRVSYPPCGV